MSPAEVSRRTLIVAMDQIVDLVSHQKFRRVVMRRGGRMGLSLR